MAGAPTAPPLYRFGGGQLWFTANGGDLPSNPTPMRLATLQGVDLEFSADMKELYGEDQYPEVVAIGKRKVTGKAKIGRWNTTIMDQFMFSGTQTNGTMQVVEVREKFTVGATPYQYTTTGAAHFAEDLGVEYANQTPLQIPSSGTLSAIGQYLVNTGTGVYTFDAADTGNAMMVSYTMVNATAGVTLEIDNQIMGYGPVFSCVFRAAFRGQEINIVLNACIAGKLSLSSKVDDFTVPEIDFQAFADANGKIGFMYASQ